MELRCTPQVFAILTALVEEHSGLSYTLKDLALFEAKAAARAADAGFESMLDYYYFLRYDDPEHRELDVLVEALTVHETFFFREQLALEVTIDTVLAPRIARGERPRVWCAACATGEEPVTLAMLLAERDLLAHTELIASDISGRALQKARRGVYSPRALRQTPLQRAARFLSQRDDTLVVDPTLLAAIDYRRINLLQPPPLAPCALILCRNVLIYFDDRRIKQVVDRLTNMLAPDGSLVVGVAESLMRFGTALRCEEVRGSFFYRKQAP